MLIYAVADLHANPRRLAAVQRGLEIHRPDVLVVAGDAGRLFNPNGILEFFDRLPVPVLFVRGNSDPPRLEHLAGGFSNVTSLHLRSVIAGGKRFVGVGGAFPLPFHTKAGLREKRNLAELDKILTVDSVLVVHPPPRGVLDTAFGRFPVGSRALFDLVRKREPALVICGHVHENAGRANIGATVVVNCSLGKNGAGALIRVKDGQAPAIDFLK